MSENSGNTVVERVPNGVRFADGRIRVENVIIAYGYLGFPGASTLKNDKGEPAPPNYRGLFLLPKRTHFAAKELVKRGIEGVLQAKNGGQAIKKANWFLRNGDDEAKAFMKGHFTITASNNEANPPGLRYKNERGAMDRKRAAQVFYDGCIVDVVISPWWQPNYGQKVNANLLAVRCVDDTAPKLATGRGGMSEEEIDNSFDYHDEGGSNWADPDEI